jgi:type IV secretory pathway VirJ component
MLKVAAAALLLTLGGAAPPLALDSGRYGHVEVVAPSSSAHGLAILFSTGEGLQPSDRARLAALADSGAIAVGVDSAAYLRNLAQAKPGCLKLFEDAEALSREVQRERPMAQYRVPIVAGEGLGGALASRVVGQSPLQTVGGALALDPAPALPLDRDICPRPLEADDRDGPGTPEAPKLKNPWIVALTPAAGAETRAHFAALAATTPLLTLRDLPAAPDPAAFAGLAQPLLAPEQAATVAGLPLVEMPASPRTRRMAVFLSGDGGWRDVDKRVSEKLQQLGVSVVGWSSLAYFWRAKTPEQTAADLSAVLDAYARKWDCDEIALIGFSFGADVMPFLYPRLDAGLRRRIVEISLLSPGEAADWEIQVAGWLGAGPSNAATPLAPAVAAMPGERVQCFYGDRDRGNSCRLFAARGAEMFEKHGDHHLGGDYDLIAREIADGLQQRASAGK